MKQFEPISPSRWVPVRLPSQGRARRGLRRHAALVLGCLSLVAAFPAIDAQASDENQQADNAKPVAEVASVQGTAEALRANGESRPLAIGDPIQAGESVRTAPGSTVGLWHDEALSQLPEKSKVRFDRNAAGQTRVTLEEGAVRVVDPRKAGEPIELVALDSSSVVLGGDREARILREKAGAYAMLCDWVQPVSVQRRAEGKSARPGDCIIAHPREAMFAAPGHSERIPLLGGAPALADAGPAIDPAGLIDPLPPVGAPGPGAFGPGSLPGSGAPGAAQALRAPCETVGVGCNGRVRVFEPDPGGDPFPGGGDGPVPD